MAEELQILGIDEHLARKQILETHMSKVNNEKSDTKKKGGDNGQSFQKNTADFHEAKDKLARPATTPVPGAHGQEPEKNPQVRPDVATGKAAGAADRERERSVKQSKKPDPTESKQ